jgi:hypothetical protein
VLEEETGELLTNFFRELRVKKKADKKMRAEKDITKINSL